MKKLRAIVLSSILFSSAAAANPKGNEDGAFFILLGVGYTQTLLNACEQTKHYANRFDKFMLNAGLGEQMQIAQDAFFEDSTKILQARIAKDKSKHEKHCAQIAKTDQLARESLGEEKLVKGVWSNPMDSLHVQAVFEISQKLIDPDSKLVGQVLGIDLEEGVGEESNPNTPELKLEQL